MTTRRILLSFWAGILLLAAGPWTATAQIIVTPNIDEFCKSSSVLTHRRTLVYVDLASISQSKTDWGLTILNRLELGTREPLTIFGLDPDTFEIHEAFDSCYPTYTRAEIDQAANSRGIIDKLFKLAPTDQQRENLQTFDTKLRNSLNGLLAEATKFVPGKRRNALGAIAFDKNRFSDTAAIYRVIVYTDGTLNDPAIDVGASESKQVGNLLDIYPANLSGADVSVFGVSGGGDQGASLEAKERVFSAFFLGAWAHLKTFSSSLPQQRADLFPSVMRMDGTFEGGGTRGAAKLSLATRNGSNMADGWLAFMVSRSTLYVPFQGEYSCSGGECKLSAAVTESVPPLSATSYFRVDDRISLQGGADGVLAGALRSAGREVFKEGQDVKYSLRFSPP